MAICFMQATAMGVWPPRSSAGAPAFPWFTCAIVLMSGLALWLSSVSEWFIYDRSLILTGQVWRCWTGHSVHFGANHFLWDMTVFLPAGCWLERLWPRRTRWFYLVCPLLISAAILALEPALDLYAGISGVATGALVLLAGLQLRRRPSEPAWIWMAVLGLVAAKIAFELVGRTPFLIELPLSVRVVPLAHISGLACGLVFQLDGRGRHGTRDHGL